MRRSSRASISISRTRRRRTRAGGGYLAPWKFIGPGHHRQARRAHRGPHVGRGGQVHPRAQGPALLPELLGLLRAFAVERAAATTSTTSKPKADPKEPAAQSALRRDGPQPRRRRGPPARRDRRSGRRRPHDHRLLLRQRRLGLPAEGDDPEGFADMPATSNLPLRSGKASIYEGGTREPCIVVWPGKTKPRHDQRRALAERRLLPHAAGDVRDSKPRADLKLDGVDQTRHAARRTVAA